MPLANYSTLASNCITHHFLGMYISTYSPASFCMMRSWNAILKRKIVQMKIDVKFSMIHKPNFELMTYFSAEYLGQKLVSCMKICLNINLSNFNGIYRLNLNKIWFLPRCMKCCGISPNKKEEEEKEGEVGGRWFLSMEINTKTQTCRRISVQ